MTDAELSLALARMLGLPKVSYNYAGSVTSSEPWVDCCGAEWNPIHNGADFDAVLMWGHQNLRCETVEQAFASEFGGVQSWVEFRRAVCQAIVEASR